MDCMRISSRQVERAAKIAIAPLGVSAAVVVGMLIVQPGQADPAAPQVTSTVTVQATPTPAVTSDAPAPVAPAETVEAPAPVAEPTSPAYVPPITEDPVANQPAPETTTPVEEIAPGPVLTMGQPNPFNPDAPPIGIVTGPSYENGASAGDGNSNG